MRYPLCRFVFALVALVLADTCLEAADRPTYRADAARTGYSPDPLPDNLKLRWIYRNRTGATPAWPCDGVFLHALDARTGEVLWTNNHVGGLYMPQPRRSGRG